MSAHGKTVSGGIMETDHVCAQCLCVLCLCKSLWYVMTVWGANACAQGPSINDIFSTRRFLRLLVATSSGRHMCLRQADLLSPAALLFNVDFQEGEGASRV